MFASIEDQIRRIAEEHCFTQIGFAPLVDPASAPHYKSWVEQSFQGEMRYLADQQDQRMAPTNHFPSVQTILSFRVPYEPHPEALPFFPALKIARYARGKDYHHWLKNRLLALSDALSQSFAGETFWACTDSFPLMERAFAHQAGNGWFGKNSCLIHPEDGSFFLLAEILTSLRVNATLEVSPDRCGTCTRCIDACPTGALVAPRVLDANRCISHWTIETQKLAPRELRQNFGEHLFGCDICQEVCPWNQRVLGTQLRRPPSSRADKLQELRFILGASRRALEKITKGTALARAGAYGIKRNALIVAENLQMIELVPEIEALLTHPKLHEVASAVLKSFRALPVPAQSGTSMPAQSSY